jgi:hypothetical protein
MFFLCGHLVSMKAPLRQPIRFPVGCEIPYLPVGLRLVPMEAEQQ